MDTPQVGLPWSIIEFSRFACGLGPEGYIAMLVAYFDESGTHGREAEVTTIAGLVGDSIEWSRLELPWKKRLAEIPSNLGKITTFHATDCAGKTGDFSKFGPNDPAGLFADLA